MNVEKMTERVAEGLNAAYSRALHEHNTQTAPEHMLAALLEQERGIAPDILAAAGADPKAIALQDHATSGEQVLIVMARSSGEVGGLVRQEGMRKDKLLQALRKLRGN